MTDLHNEAQWADARATAEAIAATVEHPRSQQHDDYLAQGGDEVVPVDYDPGADTIEGVKAYVEANPDERDDVLAAEQAGKNRTTLVDWLSAT